MPFYEIGLAKRVADYFHANETIKSLSTIADMGIFYYALPKAAGAAVTQLTGDRTLEQAVDIFGPGYSSFIAFGYSVSQENKVIKHAVSVPLAVLFGYALGEGTGNLSSILGLPAEVQNIKWVASTSAVLALLGGKVITDLRGYIANRTAKT